MKKLASLILAVLILTASFTAFASDGSLTPSSASDGVALTGEIALKAGEYVKYSDVDFTGIKSVKITGTANWSSRWNGESFELRLDGETGELLAYVSFDEDGETEAAVNISSEGVHDLYVKAMYGSAGASKIKSVALSSSAVPEKEKYVPVDESVTRDSFADT